MARKDRKDRKDRKSVEDYEKDGDDDGWAIELWINSTKAGKVLAVSKPATPKQKKAGKSGDLVGFVSVKGIERVLDDEINGIPVKSPPEDDDDDE